MPSEERVMIKSNVLPCLRVGSVTCCTRLMDSSKSLNLIALSSLDVLTCILKSPPISSCSLKRTTD